MPKKAIDYSKTVMYKIVCKDLDVKDLYVGHTTDFICRKGVHKHKTNNINSDGGNVLVYQFIRDNGNWDNWEMIQIEKYPCSDQNEALSRERYWKEQLNATLNVQVPGRTKKEYQQLPHMKEYHQEYSKQYEQTDKCKQMRKEYRESHDRSEYIHQYEQSEARKTYNELKWHCEFCNCDVQRHSRSIHMKSKKHLTNISLSRSQS